MWLPKLRNDAFRLEFRYGLEFLIKCSIGWSSKRSKYILHQAFRVRVRVSNVQIMGSNCSSASITISLATSLFWSPYFLLQLENEPSPIVLCHCSKQEVKWQIENKKEETEANNLITKSIDSRYKEAVWEVIYRFRKRFHFNCSTCKKGCCWESLILGTHQLSI